MKRDMVKIIDSQFVYDGGTGRSYAVGKYILEAVHQILGLSHPPIPVEDADKLEEAKEIVRRKQALTSPCQATVFLMLINVKTRICMNCP